MKRFIAIVERKPGVTDAIVADHAGAETAKFKELFDSGLIWEYYKQLGVGNFWLIVHSESREVALAKLRTFPYYGLGFISIELRELDESKFTRKI